MSHMNSLLPNSSSPPLDYDSELFLHKRHGCEYPDGHDCHCINYFVSPWNETTIQGNNINWFNSQDNIGLQLWQQILQYLYMPLSFSTPVASQVAKQHRIITSVIEYDYLFKDQRMNEKKIDIFEMVLKKTQVTRRLVSSLHLSGSKYIRGVPCITNPGI